MKTLRASISRWRFGKRRHQIHDEISEIILEATGALSLFREIDPDRKSRIAFISPLPPQDTGIATCSFYQIRDFPQNIDVFSPRAVPDWVRAMERVANTKSNTVKIFSIDQFLSLDCANRYDAVVIAVGNSGHHIYIFNMLKKIGAFQEFDRVWLYVHDPITLNLVQKGKKLSNLNFAKYMKDLYPEKKKAFHMMKTLFHYRELHGLFVSEKAYGWRAFTSLGIRKFLVNSNTAAQFISADVDDSCVIKTLFHPCFLPLNRSGYKKNIPSSVLRVGTFGIPNGVKMTPLIMDACDKLADRGIEIEFYMAGYGVQDYWEKYKPSRSKYTTKIFDRPTDIQLIDIMNKVDVAVQLRIHNGGESSGIVPQLLMLGKPVIVSDIGAFKEYGSSVQYFTNADGSQALATLIGGARQKSSASQINEYVVKHSIAEFQLALLNAIEDKPS